MAQHSSKIPYSQLIRPLITADRRGHGEDLCACAIMSCTLWTISIYTHVYPWDIDERMVNAF